MINACEVSSKLWWLRPVPVLVHQVCFMWLELVHMLEVDAL